MKELNYQFRQEMAQVHKPDRRAPDKKVSDGQIEIDRTWTITVPRDADAVMMNAARDLEDYFFTSMGVSVKVCYDDEAAGKTIAYSTDPTLPEYSYRFTVTDGKVELCGNNSRFAAQAGYFAEDLMNLNEAPFLTKQETVRTSLFNPRMTHSGYGLDNFPDEHISAIAHAGISALLVFVKGVDDTPFGYQDFNDLCYRAGRLGVDVYAYSYIPSLFHPDDEGAEEYYEKTYGALFDRCPLFFFEKRAICGSVTVRNVHRHEEQESPAPLFKFADTVIIDRLYLQNVRQTTPCGVEKPPLWVNEGEIRELIEHDVDPKE